MKKFKRKWKESLKRAAAMALAVLMVSNTIDMSAFAMFAAEETQTVLCEHHTEHTAECGYSEGTGEIPCTHEHREECFGKTEECVHTSHDDSCGYAEAQEGSPCTHECSEENGCVIVTENCTHTEHDETCGYQEAVEGTPCSYVCELCADENKEEQPEEQTEICICTEKCTEESANAECPVCNAEGTDVNVCMGTTELIPECTCETDDPTFHATNCTAYVAPENPECYCVEKCTEDNINVWCDVCGVQGMEACEGGEEAVVYEPSSVPVLDKTTDPNYPKIFANGTPIYIDWAEDRGSDAYGLTVVYYYDENGDVQYVNESDAIGDNLIKYTIYGGCLNEVLVGDTSITMYGGAVRAVYGGGRVYDGSGHALTSVDGNSTVTVISEEVARVNQGVYINDSIGGGTVTGDATVKIQSADNVEQAAVFVESSINGGHSTGGTVTVELTSNNSLRVGYAPVYGGSGASVNVNVGKNVEVTGNVFGANGSMTGDTLVTISGTVAKNVYGGGNSGTVTGDTKVILADGSKVGECYTRNNGNGFLPEYNYCVYGGGKAGDVQGSTEVQVGVMGSDIKCPAAIYGGGYTGVVTGDTKVTVARGATLGRSTNTNDDYFTNVYGGGYTGTVGGSTTVEIGGTIFGNVHGGSYGNTTDTTKGKVTGNTSVTIKEGGSVYYVYGGGQYSDVGGSTSVDTAKDSIVKGSLYSGSVSGTVGGKATVTIKGTVQLDIMNGGEVTGGTNVTIDGGTVGSSSTNAKIILTAVSGDGITLKNSGTLYLYSHTSYSKITAQNGYGIKVEGGTLCLATNGEKKAINGTVADLYVENDTMPITIGSGDLLDSSSGKYTVAMGTLGKFAVPGDSVTITLDEFTAADSTNYTVEKVGSNLWLKGGLESASVNGSYSYTGSPVALGLTVTDKADAVVSEESYTVKYKVQNADDSTYSTDTLTNAGSYTVKVTAKSNSAYTGEATTDFAISKAEAPTLDVINRSYLNFKENEASINIADLLPEDCGTVDYKTVTTSGTVTYSAEPSVTNGTLSYTVNRGAVDTEGTITVVVETQNYEDITITVNVKLIDQTPVSVKEGTEVTLKNSILSYGEALSELTFENVVFEDEAGNEVAGTLAWKEPATKPDVADNYVATWVFTPDNVEYASLEGTVVITVNKATPNVEAIPTVSDRVYDPAVTLKDIALTGGTVTGVDGNPLSGTWSWLFPDEVPTVNNNGCVAVFTPENTEKYNSVDTLVTLRVNKADASITVGTTAYDKVFGDADFTLEGIETVGYRALVFTVSDGKDIEGNAKNAADILTVSEDGIATIQGTGSVIVTVSMEENANYNAAEPKQIMVNVALADGFFVGELEEMTYTGKAIKPEVRVYDGTKEVLLQKGKDYTVTYKNNTKAYTLEKDDAGFDAKKAPQVIIKGKGNYSSKLTVYFTIQPKDLSDMEDESIVAKEFLLEANGKVQKKVPAITYNKKTLAGVLKPEDGSAPKKVKDFVYSYPQLAEEAIKDGAFKDAGTWQILVEGTGNYTGSRYVNVVIAAKGGKMTSVGVKSIPAQEYTGEAIDLDAEALKVTAKINGKTETLVRGTHYDVSYKNNTNIGTATVILTGIPETGFSGSKTVTFKIVGTSIAKASVEGIESKVYNGNEQTQELTVTLSKKVKTENGTETQTTTLVKDKDFTVTYDKNVNVGTAKMTIKGIGAYTGTIKKTFKITAYDMTGETDAAGNVIEGSSLTEANGLFTMKNGELSVKFVKGGAKPAVKLLFNGKTLIEGTDYAVSYKNNKNVYTLIEGMDGYKAGKAPTLTIKGKGNFKGSVSKTFVITGRDLQDSELAVTMTVNDKVVSTKKGGYISKPVLTDKDGKVLKQGKDYTAPVYSMTGENGETITLTKNDKVTEPGTVIAVTVKGLGAYAGDAEESVLVGTYRITAKNFGKVKVQTIKKEYTGRKVTLTEADFYNEDGSSKITFGSGNNKVELKYGVDFEIVPGSYKNNVKKGTATVTLRGISDTADGGSGLYGGTKTIKFQVGTRGLRGWFWWLGF